MKSLLLALVISTFVVQFASSKQAEKVEDGGKPSSKSWWRDFKSKVKTVLFKWREDLKGLWDEVMAKADDMKSWSVEVSDSFKKKFNEFVETHKDIPESEKNDIENFISRLKLPAEMEKNKYTVETAE